MPEGGGAHLTMEAVQVTAPGRIARLRLPLPEPGAGEVRVRLEGCGVCASNLEPWAGQPWTCFPLAPGELGHEGWGRIDAVGAGVAGLALGDRVALLGTRSYATHDVVPARRVVPLPPALDGAPVPGEAVGCALSIFGKAGIARGQTVAILGAGFIGLLLVQLAAGAGARVIAFSRRPAAQDLACRLGAGVAIAPDDRTEALAQLGAATGGAMADVAIEAAGHQGPLDLAAAATRQGGTLVIAGFHQGMRQVDMLDWNWRALRIVNAHERDATRVTEAMREGVDLLARGALTLAPLMTHSYPLRMLDRALNDTRDKPPGLVKAWVRC